MSSTSSSDANHSFQWLPDADDRMDEVLSGRASATTIRASCRWASWSAVSPGTSIHWGIGDVPGDLRRNGAIDATFVSSASLRASAAAWAYSYSSSLTSPFDPERCVCASAGVHRKPPVARRERAVLRTVRLIVQ